MEITTQKVFHVREEARDQIPGEIKVFKPRPESLKGFFNDVKWTKESVTYKLKSVSPATYYKGFLEVVYEIANP